MVNNYYYLVSGLPDIFLDEGKAAPSFREFTDQIEEQVAGEDTLLLRLLRYPADIKNLIMMLENKKWAFNHSGNFTEEALQNEIKTSDSLPEFMVAFIEAHKESKVIFPSLSWENQLNWLFYDWVLESSNPFVLSWFTLELHLRNLLSGLICRKFNKPLEQHIIGQNDVSELILKSNAPDFSLTPILPWVDKIVALPSDNMVEHQKSIDTFRWDMLDELAIFSYFQIETILAFCIKLSMVERWNQLNPATGKEMFNRLVNEIKNRYQISKDYIKTGGKK